MAAMDRSRTADLLERRRGSLGAGYRLFYKEPLEIVRGTGVHVYDAAGNEYLDAYNNVPVVGHAHPRVVEAISRQASQLNTHTRYLSRPILDYAERLLASLGSGVDRAMFTCSGSEAIDLALRIARFKTGKAGFVVTANAYHGVTMAAAAISPSLGPKVAPGPAVRVLAPPPPTAQDAEVEGNRMATELHAAVDELEAAGHGFAALIVDTILSSDGILPEPRGFLRPVARSVADRGGLLVADEVQSGFARTGEAMWGFERHGLTPDLVTMGKPMGNGMPIAALAGRADLLDDFGREVRYFNTFGGNSVSVAAATATLDVIEDERLQGNAREVGAALLTDLSELAERHAGLSNPRGIGLFLAVDVGATDVEDHLTAARVADGLRDRGVLVGTTGPTNGVLKIRPPLPFSPDNASQLIGALGDTVRQLES